MGNTKIVDCRIIKLSFPVNYMGFWIFLFQFPIIGKCGLFCAVILYYHIFIISVTAFFLNGPDAAFQIIRMIFVRYYNRNQRIIVPDIMCPVKPQVFPVLHAGLHTDSVIMCQYSFLSCFKGVFLTLRVFCC